MDVIEKLKLELSSQAGCLIEPTFNAELRIDTLVLEGIDHLPESVFELTTLREFGFKNMTATELPDGWHRLQKLNLLVITGSIERLPESIGHLKHLKRIYLNMPITRLPESIGNLSELTSFYSRCRLTELPESIGKLQSLTSLDINHNQLISLPSTLGQLKNLKHLNLSSNQLESLPQSLDQIKTLESLILVDNNLQNIQILLIMKRLPNLKRLSLRGNKSLEPYRIARLFLNEEVNLLRDSFFRNIS